MEKSQAIDIVVFGVVQGVGFRPFIYRTARKLNYRGWVKNVGFGVEIHLEADSATDFEDFFNALEKEKPPLSLIEKLKSSPGKYHNCEEFLIQKTKTGQSFVFISPDIAVCENCHTEMLTESDRRFCYPFINCTDCGPRYTIVNALPYDRDKTTMDSFKMCGDCHAEYTDPMDRRYHAQPIACPVCGPQVSLIDARTRKTIPGGIKEAAEFIKKGYILTVKGLGGFHLVCDALNPEAVKRLRTLKTRKTKPLALMARNLAVVERYASLNASEKAQLCSARRPIVLLKQKTTIEEIAPGLNEIGFMLPYTPLHFLLLENIDLIVATSSNKKDSPIMKDEEEGIYELCDYILTHDRPIYMRADDSVMKLVDDKPLFLRRARGYVPYPQPVPKQLRYEGHILALGAELKDTVSIYKNGYVVTSQFLGDLDEYQNFKYFEETITHLSKLFEVKPDVVVTDLHPDFHTTRFAQKMGIPHLQIQHHYAHVLAAMMENNIPPGQKVLGVSWDGFGYGEDGTAWGGEFLIADYAAYERIAHFDYVPLPGGDLAAKQPWRMGLSYLISTFGEDIPTVKAMQKVEAHKIKGVQEMIKQKINSPEVSSCGRLFDAVSFLVGLAPFQVEYEAEAPMLFEAAVDLNETGDYFEDGDMPNIISFREAIKSILIDLEKGVPAANIAAKFHNTLARLILSLAVKARKEQRIETVVLVGGVFLNKTLLNAAKTLLENKRFKVIRPMLYSPNDESISIGQIAYALNYLKSNKKKAEQLT